MGPRRYRALIYPDTLPDRVDAFVKIFNFQDLGIVLKAIFFFFRKWGATAFMTGWPKSSLSQGQEEDQKGKKG